MNARANATWLRAPSPIAWNTAGSDSPELVEAVDALAAYSLRQPDPTLEELQRDLQGTAFTWSSDGNLTFAPDRTKLVNELDELSEVYGREAKAAYLFPSIGAIVEGA